MQMEALKLLQISRDISPDTAWKCDIAFDFLSWIGFDVCARRTLNQLKKLSNLSLPDDDSGEWISSLICADDELIPGGNENHC